MAFWQLIPLVHGLVATLPAVEPVRPRPLENLEKAVLSLSAYKGCWRVATTLELLSVGGHVSGVGATEIVGAGTGSAVGLGTGRAVGKIVGAGTGSDVGAGTAAGGAGAGAPPSSSSHVQPLQSQPNELSA